MIMHAPKVVDSGKLAQDGSYKLKGVSKEQNLYLLTIDHAPVSIFINDNNDIRISTDLNTNFAHHIFQIAMLQKVFMIFKQLSFK